MVWTSWHSNFARVATASPHAVADHSPHSQGGRSSRHSDLTVGQTLPGIALPVYFGLRDHTVYQLTLPRLEAQSSGKNTLSSVWPGSSAIACNFGEGSDFPSDRKQMPRLTTLAACKILVEKLNREKVSSSLKRRQPFIRQSPTLQDSQPLPWPLFIKMSLSNKQPKCIRSWRSKAGLCFWNNSPLRASRT